MYDLEDDSKIGQEKLVIHKDKIQSINFKLRNLHDEIYYT